MRSPKPTILLSLALAAALTGAGALLAQAPDSSQAPPKSEAAKKAAAAEDAKAAGATTPAAAPTYVGSETCQMCHDEIVKNFEKNPHKAIHVNPSRGWKAEACESCHGPGSVHAESTSAKDIKNPARLRVTEADRICQACHGNQKTQAGRIQSGHARNQVACFQCHAIHGTQGMGKQLRQAAAVNALCASCHNNIWAEFQRPYTHKLPQGAMSCTDCHNPHGSLIAGRMVRAVSANEPGCLRCHTDKRGPFLFEHAPVRTEGCGACHMPHGSANPKMLTRPQERLVCLECHSNLPQPTVAQATLGAPPPAFHDLRSPRYRSCSVCHVKIHGSYVNRAFTR